MSYRVPAVYAAIRVLRCLQEHQDELCLLSEIARALNLSKSTCHGILQTLKEDGLVVHDEITRGYRLGPGLISLGASAARRDEHVVVALPFVRKLVQEIKFACIISQLLPKPEIVVVDKAESLKDIKVTVAVGERFPITAAAMGKSFLAWMTRCEAAAILERVALPQYTPNSITEIQAFLGELDRVQALGYSESRGEYYLQNNAVACPVFGRDGHVVLVLCILGFRSELTDELIPHYGLKLKDVATAITAAIGGSFPASIPYSEVEHEVPVFAVKP